jgi:hypothetical protein
MSLGRPFSVFSAFALLISVSIAASAQPTRSDIEAAFLPRFARYVTWPPAARPGGSDPFVLCVIGNNPFGNGLDTAARGQSVDGRRIVVRRLDSVLAAGQCHIAFVGGSRAQSVGQMLADLRGKPILTVTDSNDTDARGIIHFAVTSGRVRFYINDADAGRRGLDISSRLLALAIAVKQR